MDDQLWDLTDEGKQLAERLEQLPDAAGRQPAELPIINIHGTPYADVTQALLDPEWQHLLGIAEDPLLERRPAVTAELTEDVRTFHCPICHKRSRTADGALSRIDNATRICSGCGKKQAASQMMRMRAEIAETKVIEYQFCPLMVANTVQLRRLAGIAQQLDMSYGLDFRLDTVLDFGGLHVLNSHELAMPRGDDGLAEAVVTADVSLKVAFLTEDQPIETVVMSVRLRDWVALMEPDPMEKMIEGIKDVSMQVDTRLLIPDEFTPDRIDPASPEASPGRRPRLPRRRGHWEALDTTVEVPRAPGSRPPVLPNFTDPAGAKDPQKHMRINRGGE